MARPVTAIQQEIRELANAEKEESLAMLIAELDGLADAGAEYVRGRSMTKAKRNVDREILEGIREIKRGEHGRVTKIPLVAGVRKGTGISRTRR